MRQTFLRSLRPFAVRRQLHFAKSVMKLLQKQTAARSRSKPFFQFSFYHVYMRLFFRVNISAFSYVNMLFSDIADVIAPDICLLSRVALFSRVYDVLFSHVYVDLFSHMYAAPFLAHFCEEPLFSARKGVPHTLPQKRLAGCASVISTIIICESPSPKERLPALGDEALFYVPQLLRQVDVVVVRVVESFFVKNPFSRREKGFPTPFPKRAFICSWR